MPVLTRKIACHSALFISLLSTGCFLQIGGDDDEGAVCTPTGAELCDGIDNDCDPTTLDGADEPTLGQRCDGADADLCEDGVQACTNGTLACAFDDTIDEECADTAVLPAPTFQSSFPAGQKAAAAAHVAFKFDYDSSYQTAECRTGFPGTLADTGWKSCASWENDRQAYTVYPHSDTESGDAAYDGPKETHIRFITGTGARTQPYVAYYYVHSSLHGVTQCALSRPVEEYFDAAKSLLNWGGGAPIRTQDVHLANPFIQVRFYPPVEATYEVADKDGEVDVKSLRRVFTLNKGTGDMLMVYRSYVSKRGHNTCNVATIRKREYGNDKNRRALNHHNVCEALVFNSRGAGVCLRGTGSGVTVVYEGDRRFHPLADYFGEGVPAEYTCGDKCADNFMWRKIKQVYRGNYRYFSPKCTVRSECTDEQLYVPGRDWYPDIFR